jgi:Tfp pilus assembly protein PilF
VVFDAQGNAAEAEAWWRKAAQAGNADAQNNVGWLLEQRGELGEAAGRPTSATPRPSTTWNVTAPKTAEVHKTDVGAPMSGENRPKEST